MMHYCTCPAGQSGSESRDATTESTVRLLNLLSFEQNSIDNGKTNQCSDSYWRKIGATKGSSTITVS